jgi:hypothetical protein
VLWDVGLLVVWKLAILWFVDLVGSVGVSEFSLFLLTWLDA